MVVITVEIVWLVVLSIAIVTALIDALIILSMEKGGALVFSVVLGQWVALGVIGGILSAILTT